MIANISDLLALIRDLVIIVGVTSITVIMFILFKRISAILNKINRLSNMSIEIADAITKPSTYGLTIIKKISKYISFRK